MTHTTLTPASARRLALAAASSLALLAAVTPGAGRAAAPPADAPVATVARSAIVGLYAADSPAPADRVRAVNEVGPVRVGLRFKAKVSGRVVGIRVYQPFAGRSATPRTAELWSPSGRRVATTRFTPSAGIGWKSVRFADVARIKPGKVYTAVVYAPKGRYARTPAGFERGRSNAFLKAPAKLNGVIQKGSRHTFPTRPARGHRSFWVDVMFRPSAGSASSSSAAATSSARGCVVDPGGCGYPDAGSAGPDSLVGLTAVPESVTSGPGWSWNSSYRTVFVTGANAVLDRLDVHGAVVIDAPNVTVSNSRIASCGGSDDTDVVAIRYRAGSEYRGSGARIVSNQILGTPSGCTHRARSGVRDVYGEAPNVLVKDNDISGTGNGITIEHEGLIEDNWIHDLGHLAGDHHSGISNHGGAVGVVVRHNTVLLYGQKFAGGGGVSGALTVYADFGHAQNVTLQDNLISGGSYVVYGGESGDSYSSTATNIKILDNRFVCGDWLYGAIAAFDPRGAGNQLAGNYCDQDGKTVK